MNRGIVVVWFNVFKIRINEKICYRNEEKPNADFNIIVLTIKIINNLIDTIDRK